MRKKIIKQVENYITVLSSIEIENNWEDELDLKNLIEKNFILLDYIKAVKIETQNFASNVIEDIEEEMNYFIKKYLNN